MIPHFALLCKSIPVQVIGYKRFVLISTKRFATGALKEGNPARLSNDTVGEPGRDAAFRIRMNTGE
jgi:hypothetical protein